MYLKSLQVVGFKSFADRTTLEFHRGVTAIVGPNGCGKSNVLDSIRWVLGEQSAKALRGGEMRDVIFSGTDTRSALGMAEVSLTFAECEKELGTEFHEVTLTRRVFRDGASEYEINRTGCRLRDIQELFMDTGVGRTAYSIMEQGKIDLILSSRPEDRRAIFEEAAGITKYKSQKKEALRKLESTEANLLRLADVVREVKRQVGSLQRQAAKAKRFQAAQIELSAIELRVGRRHYDVYSETINKLEAVVGTSRAQQERVSSQLADEEARTEESKGELANIDLELARLRDEQNNLRNAVERSQQKAQSNRARVEEFTKMAEQAKQEVESTTERISQGESQLEELNAQVEDFREAQAETKRKFDQAQVALNELNRRLNGCKGESAQAEAQKLQQEKLVQRQEQEAAALAAQQIGFQERFHTLRLDETAVLQRVEETKLHVAQLAEQVKQEEAALLEKKTTVQHIQQLQREADDALKVAERQRNETNRLAQNLQARRDALAQLQRQNVDAPQATQRLLKTGAAELLGTLAQRISVKAGYEKPLALLLGDAFQALLISDEAQTVIWRQKLNKNEQCVFAPVTAPRQSENAAKLPGTAARNYLTADESVAELVGSLLEEAHVVADLAAAWSLKANCPTATVVTEAGELINRSGLLFVGQDSGAALAVLSRQAELRKLEAEIQQASQTNSQAQAVVDQAQQAVRDRQAQMEEVRQEMQELEIALSAMRQEERTSRASLEQLTRQRDQTEREVARLEAQENDTADKLERLQTAMAEAKRVGQNAADKLDAIQIRLTEMEDEEHRQSEAIVAIKMELASQTHQVEAWQQQREPVARRLQELTEVNKKRARELQEHQERVEKAQAEIIESDKMAENKAVFLATVVEVVESTKVKRSDLAARITSREAALRILRQEQGSLQENRSADEVSLAEQRMLLNNLRQRFQHDYQKELEQLPLLSEEDENTTDWKALDAEAKEKRTALEAMGPVNIEAIAEYDELEQRQQFLVTQEADLIKSRDQLLQAIKEINQTTQRLFYDTFQQIKKNFQEMFTELFGGGKADLILQDENDPLESGIEIVAKPPGKQPQSITLLSGGEKTMTAVALLFSIYLVKPSPFCVLDEMDAPLDESNINRFIKILQRFVHQSQFVVITHNKRTISIADVLYGVTMEERGVSRFVSMRLNKNTGESTPMNQGDRDDGVPSLADAVSRN